MYAAIPEYDFNGASFVIATNAFHGSETEVCPDGMTGEGINDAIYLRTEAENERFNRKILRVSYTFSKDMAAENNFGDLYDLVKEGKWTIDAMKEMSEAVSNDVDGNGVYDADDIYSYMSYEETDSFFYGSGLQWVKYEADGIPVLSVDTDRAVSVLDKVSVFFTSGHSYYTAKDSSEVFTKGNGLFLHEVVSYVMALNGMEDDFGILSLPKYDETQDSYFSYMHRGATASSIPNNGNDPEMIGALIEALAIQSHMLLKPAFYDSALQRRCSRDEESSEMLDLIFVNRIYDFGYYAVGQLNGIFGKLCFNSETTLASRYKAVNKVVTNTLAEYVDTFSD